VRLVIMSVSPLAEFAGISTPALCGCAATEEKPAEADRITSYPGDAPAEHQTVPRASSSSIKARSLAAGQVNRVVDGAVPEGMSVSRDARIALQKCATISLLYLACLANAERRAAGSSRTTLNVQDIRAALEAAGMTHLLPLMATAAKRSRD
jgi:histone H3/H4